MREKFCLLFFLYTLASFAQREANIWYFGENAGLDFNSGTPVALTNGQLDTLEGCATISNNNGQLLFYTDGITVWNRNHVVMPNGYALEKGNKYRLGTLTVGYKGYRVGVNSEHVRHAIQDQAIHNLRIP